MRRRGSARRPPGRPAHAERAAAWLLDALGVELPGGLLGLALTHRSFAYENGGLPTNERLEFLGDSVLGLVVTDELYRSQPDLPEGQLAKLRASVVNMTSLAGVARRLGEGGIGPHLLLGRGEETTGGRDKDSILADAARGADRRGPPRLRPGRRRAVVHRLFDPLLVEAADPRRRPGLEDQPPGARRRPRPRVPRRTRSRTTGPDHAKTFTAAVVLAGTVYGTRHRPHQEGRRAGGRRGRLARAAPSEA